MHSEKVIRGILLTLLATPSVAAQSGPFFDNADGTWHWYEVIDVPGGVTWDQANAAAVVAGGYLATITSLGENDFIFSLLNSNSYWFQDTTTTLWNGPWIGGHQNPIGDPIDGWGWSNLEEVVYTNWAAGFPVGSDFTNRIQFGGSDTGRINAWADAPRDSCRTRFKPWSRASVSAA